MGSGRTCCESLLAGGLGIVNMITTLMGIVIAAIGVFLYFTEADYFPKELTEMAEYK